MAVPHDTTKRRMIRQPCGRNNEAESRAIPTAREVARRLSRRLAGADGNRFRVSGSKLRVSGWAAWGGRSAGGRRGRQLPGRSGRGRIPLPRAEKTERSAGGAGMKKLPLAAAVVLLAAAVACIADAAVRVCRAQ